MACGAIPESLAPKPILLTSPRWLERGSRNGAGAHSRFSHEGDDRFRSSSLIFAVASELSVAGRIELTKTENNSIVLIDRINSSLAAALHARRRSFA
ncbi:MAG TPA: hypothetical protein VGG79_17990 [Roseiarcus sp.]|jgi:hypothetical protein